MKYLEIITRDTTRSWGRIRLMWLCATRPAFREYLENVATLVESTFGKTFPYSFLALKRIEGHYEVGETALTAAHNIWFEWYGQYQPEQSLNDWNIEARVEGG